MAKTVLFYAVNGLGLGHLTRLLAIARQVKRIDPEVRPVFFTSSEACNVLHQHGIPYYKAPSKNIIKEAGLRYGELQLMYQSIVSSIVAVHRPCAMVVDTFPKGAADDLMGILTVRNGMKKVFVHREQRPEKMTPNRIMLQKLYDLVLTPHREGEAIIPVPEGVPLEWCGNVMVRDESDLLPRHEARALLNIPQDKRAMLVSMGGGGDPTTEDDLRCILEVLRIRKDIQAVLPLEPLRRDIPEVSGNVSLIRWYPLMELMSGFDGAISAAGYNTFHELMHCGVPTAFIPKKRGYDDQTQRAEGAVAHGAALCVSDTRITEDLPESVDRLLERDQRFSAQARAYVPKNGARVAAEHILRLIS